MMEHFRKILITSSLFLLDGLFLFLWPHQNGIGFSLGASWLWLYLFPQHIFVKQNIESYVFIEWYCFCSRGLYQITWHLAGGQAVPNFTTLTKHAVSGVTYATTFTFFHSKPQIGVSFINVATSHAKVVIY